MLRKSLTYLNNWIKDKTRKPLVLRGARQVGKSTLVRLFASSTRLRLKEINLEKHRGLNEIFATNRIRSIVAALEDIIGSSFDIQRDILFLDEIQATPAALGALRYFYEEFPELPVIAAGSLLEFALGEETLSVPVGRVTYHHIYPMTFSEFLIAAGEDRLADRISKIGFSDEELSTWPQTSHNLLMTHLADYCQVGGMPEAVQAFIDGKSAEKVRQIQAEILSAYVDDFAKYARQSELGRLQRIYQAIPGHIGKKVKFAEIARDEKAANTRRCLRLLADARVISEVIHSDCNGLPLTSQRDASVFKVYFLDIGLLACAQRLPWIRNSDRWASNFAGAMSEQFTAQQLISSMDGPMRPELSYWLREGKVGNAEVDFVIQSGSSIIPIEVKSSTAGHLRSMQQFAFKHQTTLAMRVNTGLPSKTHVSVNMKNGAQDVVVEYDLITIPPYLVEFLSHSEF